MCVYVYIYMRTASAHERLRHPLTSRELWQEEPRSHPTSQLVTCLQAGCPQQGWMSSRLPKNLNFAATYAHILRPYTASV